MARGEHPMRTPFYGALVIVAAMVAATAVTTWSHPTAVLRAIVLILCGVAVLVGLAMTLRDNSRPRR